MKKYPLQRLPYSCQLITISALLIIMPMYYMDTHNERTRDVSASEKADLARMLFRRVEVHPESNKSKGLYQLYARLPTKDNDFFEIAVVTTSSVGIFTMSGTLSINGERIGANSISLSSSLPPGDLYVIQFPHMLKPSSIAWSHLDDYDDPDKDRPSLLFHTKYSIFKEYGERE